MVVDRRLVHPDHGPLPATWWALWIIGSFGAAQRVDVEERPAREVAATILHAVSSAILVAGSAVAIVVVRQVTAAIERKEREIQAMPATGVFGSEPPARLAGESVW